jgi:hypothetical protein
MKPVVKKTSKSQESPNRMTRNTKNFRPPSDDEIACHAYAIYAQEHPRHAMEIWHQAEAQLVADRKHDAGLFDETNARTSFQQVFGR